MTRFRITVEYDGSGFVGWQRQRNGASVQQAVEAAIRKFCGEEITIYAAGRTDAGVHALGQVAHFDLDREVAPGKLTDALNAHLRPDPIAIVGAAIVDDNFDARRSARERAYLYRIVNRRAPLTVARGHAWHIPVRLDLGAMHEAAQRLVGHHDFTTFRAAECQARSPVKTLDVLDVAGEGDEILIRARARSFLRHQVRNLVGTIKLVGEGKWSADDVSAALDARDRARGGPTAPPDGLYLTEVVYPPGDGPG